MKYVVKSIWRKTDRSEAEHGNAGDAPLSEKTSLHGRSIYPEEDAEDRLIGG